VRVFLCIALTAGLCAACEGYYDPDGVVLIEACDQAQKVNSIRPRNEADDAYGAGYVVVTLQCPVQNGVIAVRTVTGEPVSGLLNLHHDGRQVRFRPSPPCGRRRPTTPFWTPPTASGSGGFAPAIWAAPPTRRCSRRRPSRSAEIGA
jgi:hypothetical protein